MDPKHLERRLAATTAKTPRDSSADGTEEGVISLVAQDRQELRFIAIDERNIPLDINAESAVPVSAHGKIRSEKNRQIDSRLLGDAPQQWGLILNRMADQISQSHRSSGALYSCTSELGFAEEVALERVMRQGSDHR
jgi:hypothetical protein